jgi:hypothetical protein
VIQLRAGVLAGDLEPASEAYVDADWIGREGEVPALLVSDGRLVASWDDTLQVVSTTPLEAAGRALRAVAEAAASAAGAASATVNGAGLVARWTRELLDASASGDSAPEVVIETRSTPEALLESTRRVADLGTVVLAGVPGGSFGFDLYGDVHVRGLRVVSLALPLSRLAPRPVDALEEPATVRVGEPLAPAAWYHVVGA